VILGQSFQRGRRAVYLFAHAGGEDDRGKGARHHHGQVVISFRLYFIDYIRRIPEKVLGKGPLDRKIGGPEIQVT
jgi:hypothetical protein